MIKFFYFVLLWLMPFFIFSSENLTLRPGKPGDEIILRELILELAAIEKNDITKLSCSLERLKKFGFSDHPFFYTELALLNEQAIGYAIYFYGFSVFMGQPLLYIEDLYVKPQYQRKGIGTKILKKLASYAKEKECCRMEWHVFEWNKNAIRFYEKLGTDFRPDLIQVRLEKEKFEALLRDSS